MRVRPKYQVFISSTYGDLREEREAVTWAVLSARHIPAGMENFTATDDRGWQTIRSVIDRSDYYILILAGRYGSIDHDGMSWTEKEYEYAISKNIPVLVFIRTKRSITADLTDDSPSLRKKLEAFKDRVRNHHLTLEWTNKADLVGHVSNALRNHIDDDEDGGRSRPGWYRGNDLPSFETLDEFARISNENARLHAELESIKSSIDQVSPLTLVDHSDESVSDKITSERKIHVYGRDLTTLEGMQQSTYGNRYLAMNILQQVRLAVHNRSGALIEHITVDFSLDPILGFQCSWSGEQLSKGGLTNSTINEEYKHKFPDSIVLLDIGKIRIRFRIPNVPAGGVEYLPMFVVLGAIRNQQTWFDLTYRVVGSVGAPLVGSIRYEINFVGVIERNEEEDRRNLEKNTGIIIPENMFLKA